MDKVAKPTIKQLAHKLNHCLPRELRNCVYKYCLEYPHDHDVVVRRAAEGNDLKLFIREHIYQRHYGWMEDPIGSSASAQNLGLDTAKEILQSYYWSRNFKFSGRALFLLVSFLKTDMFGLGIIPTHRVTSSHLGTTELAQNMEN
jgi:hypothetical protein